MTTERQETIAQAERLAATLECVECGATESLADYIRDHTDPGDTSVEFECTECGHDTVEVAAPDAGTSIDPKVLFASSPADLEGGRP